MSQGGNVKNIYRNYKILLTSNGGINHRNNFVQFRFESGEKISRPPNANQTIGIGQLGEDSNFIVIFKMSTDNCHDDDFAKKKLKFFFT